MKWNEMNEYALGVNNKQIRKIKRKKKRREILKIKLNHNQTLAAEKSINFIFYLKNSKNILVFVCVLRRWIERDT